MFKKKPEKRSFDGAKGTRYTSDWTATTGNADKFLRNDVESLRSRARDLIRNNPYANGIVSEIVSNVVGQKGIMVKPQARKADARNKGGLSTQLDAGASEKIAAAWEDFSKRGNFDVTGLLSRAAFERLSIQTEVVDGGFLIRMVDGFENSSHGFAVQGIETEALDPKYSDDSRRIFMSVEHDKWDRPIAYHLLKRSDKAQVNYSREREVIPATDMLYLFRKMRAGQTQGYSWFAPIMTMLRHLERFEEAEVIAARISANKLGFFEQTGEEQWTGDEDELGNMRTPSAPGEFEKLPKGVKATMIDPSHPNANYPDFRKAILRGICSNFPTNYNTVARDLEGVNYSSIRQGVLSERDLYKIEQDSFIEGVTSPVYLRWLKMALFMGKIEGLTLLDFPRCAPAEFSGRTWAWVDPLKDVQAYEAEVTLGINSRQQICRERGKDFAKIVAENEEDSDKLISAGLAQSADAQSSPQAEAESSFDMQSKEKLDAVGAAVRAGVITPSVEIEESIREMLSLPEMGAAVADEWAENPIRSPITLTNQLASPDQPAESAPQMEVEDSPEDEVEDDDENDVED